VQVRWVLLPELPQPPTESPGWDVVPHDVRGGPRRGRTGRLQGPVGLDPMATAFAAIAAGAPRTNLGQGNG